MLGSARRKHTGLLRTHGVCGARYSTTGLVCSQKPPETAVARHMSPAVVPTKATPILANPP